MPDIAAVTEEEFISFIRDNKYLKPCFVCGSNEWGASVEFKGNTPSIILTDESGRLVPNTAYPIAMMSCKNCGNSLIFNKVIVRRAIDSSKSGINVDE